MISESQCNHSRFGHSVYRVAVWLVPLLLSVVSDGRAVAALSQITSDSFLPTASIYTFEGLPGTGLYSPTDFQYIFGGDGYHLPWFDGSVSSTAGLFGSLHYANVRSSGPAPAFEAFSDFALEFTAPQPAVGVWIGQLNTPTMSHASQVTFRIFDESSNLLAAQTVTLLPYTMGPQFLGFASDIPIRRAVVIGDQKGFYGVDNITYGMTVPEPSAFLSGITALCAASCLIRHR